VVVDRQGWVRRVGLLDDLEGVKLLAERRFHVGRHHETRDILVELDPLVAGR